MAEHPSTFEAGDLLSLITSLNRSLSEIRDAIKSADATVASLAGAPVSAAYVVAGALDSTLTGERLLTGTAEQVTVTDGGAGGAITLSLPNPLVFPGVAVIPNNTVFGARDSADENTLELLSLDTSERMVVGLGITAGDGEIRLGNAAGANARILQFFERSADPGAGGADTARLYAKDNGSAKTQLIVRFNSGAVQVLATEP